MKPPTLPGQQVSRGLIQVKVQGRVKVKALQILSVPSGLQQAVVQREERANSPRRKSRKREAS